MTDSNRILDQQFTNQYHEPSGPPADSMSDQASDHPITTGVSVVSGGLAGALLGQFVGGRFGAAIGAVVGGVAGAALSKEAGDGIDQAVSDATATVKDKVAEIKPSVQHAVATAKDKVQDVAAQAPPPVQNAIETVKDKVQSSSETVKNKVQPSSTDAAVNKDIAIDELPAQTDTAIQGGETVIDPAAIRNYHPTIATRPQGETAYQAEPAYSSAVDAASNPTVIQSSPTVLQSPSVQPPVVQSQLSVDEQYERGLEFGKQGNLVNAIAAFQSVIEQEPDYAEAHYNLGVVLGRHGLREQGIEHIQMSRDLCRTQGRQKEADNIEQILQKLGV